MGGNTLILNSGGFIASTTGFSNRTNFNNGTLTAGDSNALYFHQGGENTFNAIHFLSGSIIADNTNGAVDVIYAGRVADDAVDFTLNSTGNTYTGRTFINNAGVDMSNHAEVAGNASIFGLVPTTFTAGNVVFNGVFFKQGSYSFHENRGIELGGAGLHNHNGNLAINGAISGTGQILASSGVLTLGGSMDNTYSGDTIVAYGGLGVSPDLRLDLNKQDGAIAVPGDLFISVPSNSPNNSLSNAVVRLLASNQIANTSVVTMLRPDNDASSTGTSRAILRLNGHNETIAGLVGMAGTTATNVVVENSAAGASTLTVAPGAGRIFAYEGVVQNGGTGSLALVLNGNATGRQIFAGPNTYTGDTTITSGILQVDGTTSGQGEYLLQSNGTLAGSGTIGAIGLNSFGGGTLSPGGVDAPGTLAFDFGSGSAVLDATIALAFRIQSGGQDAIELIGSTKFDISFADLGFSNFLFSIEEGITHGTYSLISGGAGSIVGSLDENDLSGQVGNYFVTLSISGDDSALFATVIPEPRSYALFFALLALGLVLCRRRVR